MPSLCLAFPGSFSGRLPVDYCPRPRPAVRCSGERQDLFNRIAPVYDNVCPLFFLAANRGDFVLDLCCGSGDLAFLLSEKVGSSGKVVGLDFSSEQLAIASSRQNLRAKPCYKNIEWVEGDALELPFADGVFDAITMGYGLRNVFDRQRAMREMYRVLKPDSRISILDFNKSHQPVTAFIQEWMINNVVVPAAAVYGLASDYEYLKSSINGYLTGEELETLALQAGFSSAKHYEVSGGLMGNLVAMR
ncbi:PREDICTED: 2-phytyl-1,4-beta-naphthoquinone methyltransferase, chloroplastic isoform X4 [Tarenaya hassleriana]|uniref:2-phytyl-1,4-beta-naphthoquinone methyltransferase, chloroplastic isoform X4 n=1 Tax=Tarenaya hassleriana TaxID=28532 RepID=UPI00053C32E3|nr:PREDICTED: 2-phytyl-1,4-beta-naphthoquinone methyltransferase, chloroplastic isoform X4 [Tarenaya hassleriana]